MKRFSIILITILFVLMLSSCGSLSAVGDFFEVEKWSWDILKTETIKESSAIRAENVVKTIDEGKDTAVGTLKDVAENITENLENTTQSIIDEVSQRFDVTDEKVDEAVSNVAEVLNETKDEVVDVVETTSSSLETAVSDVLNSISSSANRETKTDNKVENKTETKTEDTAKASTSSSANNEKSSTVPIEEIGSKAVLVIILIAIGLIGIAIAYYCISIKRKSY